MNKKHLIIILIFSLILTSCGQIQQTSFQEDFFKGKQGLVMSFSRSTPPTQISENEQFGVFLTIKNKGAYDVEKFQQKLNFDSLYFINPNTESPLWIFNQLGELISMSEPLYGKSIAYPLGDETYVSYDMKTKKLQGQLQNPSSKLNAAICYTYQTIFAESVCMEKDPGSLELSAKPCNREDNVYSAGQGAPVSVIKLETDFLVNDYNVKPYFRIYFKNVGTGIPLNSDVTFNACDGLPIETQDWHKIKIEAELSGEKLDCGDGILGLNTATPNIVCRATQSEDFARGGTAYSRFLRVVAEYGYFDQISAEVNILRQG